jgi:hypothetical protein
MDEAKIYNVCLMRVKFQIMNARQRLNGSILSGNRQLLESYNTGDITDIIDILELYDLDDQTRDGLAQKLDDLAYTVSILVKDKIAFDYDERGNLGLYLLLKESSLAECSKADAALTAAY